jgi:hypothetical protein
MSVDNSSGGKILKHGGCLAQMFTAVVSVTALVIAILSWKESQYGRLINQGSSRAVAYVTDLKIARELDGDAIATIVVKNFGQSSAKALTVNWRGENRESQPFTSEVNFPHPGSQSWQDLPPGYQKETNIQVGVPIEGDVNSDKRTYIFGILSYVDEASGQFFNHKWCFELQKTKEEIRVVPCMTF